MSKNKKILKIDKSGLKKLRVSMVLGFLVFIALVVRIGYIQFVQGNYLKEQAIKNQLTSKTIEASRGTIYDSSGKVLAKSANVDTVYINPTELKANGNTEVNKELLAQTFSNIFDLDYEETLEKLNTKTTNFAIAPKVSHDRIEELQAWLDTNKIVSGISVTEDIKRFYPYNNLASNLIGFTGAENTGRMGLEYTLNDILSRYTW